MKHWRDQKGKRWYKSAHIRVTRLFRYHVANRPATALAMRAFHAERDLPTASTPF